MTITPTPVPAGDEPTPPTRYAWDRIEPGEWGVWVGSVVDGHIRPADIDDDSEALRTATRVRLAAKDWARRHGYHLESRRREHGRVLLLRFTLQGPHSTCADTTGLDQRPGTSWACTDACPKPE